MVRASRFEGTIGRTVADSQPWYDEPPHPGADAPNVVVVLLDDTGFAQFGCYGSDIDTPNVDALAANGLQFTNFHVTPLCSPTRAALLTGRSQHAVGMRTVANMLTGFPNQLGHISNHATTIAEVLREEGYATFCAGKWHLAPTEQCSAAGPVDQWPLARGFDRFYGFLDGETDQFHPQLVCDNHPIDPPGRPEDGYHLSEDLVDQALKMVADSKGVRPDRPFFLYVPFGATHAPHQAPESYLAKYAGKYDDGWDAARQRCYERQLETGVIPQGTQLAPRNPGVDPWDGLGENQRKLASRLQEAFAAFLDHTDDQIGRLIEGLRELGQLDNTIVIVLADNGASQEGGPFGVLHEMQFFNSILNGALDTPDDLIDRLDDIGGPHSHTNYPWGWAQCGNTPFKWYKQNTHEGGVHVPLIVHYPDRIAADQRGTMRNQFVYVSDIAPTIYDLLGITPPQTYRGIEQLPVTGHSFAGVIDDPGASATNSVQYFEMMGSRAIVADEWKAVCKHVPGADFDTEPWELYHLATDWSECVDLAGEQPERLKELIELWWSEAEQNGVLPLDDRTMELFGPRFRPNSPHPPDEHYVYRPPMSPLPMQAGPAIAGRGFRLTAHITRSAGQDGVLFSTGNENAGISVFVQNDRLVVDYNAFDTHSIVESNMAIPDGDATLVADVRRGQDGSGAIGIEVNGQAAGSVTSATFMRIISTIGASIGFNHGSAVSSRYDAPFTFAGKLHKLEIQLVDDEDPDTRRTEAAAEMRRQ
ncbi:arylsulfatase [Mycobacterium spongiae]|uniref:Sulfatase-like hydrolase/transferase n=1 Tax=Mycobacterium spongiae TaxID=886343 RepID=A0A975JW35_9MYCO|nr:arylsulfatase [Mycobacterium spongiae]QUR66767.1 sulfatase-like hydrolase/transferase [Mycobacterium spongiae]